MHCITPQIVGQLFGIDEQIEARRNKKRIQQEKIDRLYPKV